MLLPPAMDGGDVGEWRVRSPWVDRMPHGWDKRVSRLNMQ